jgi:two-component system, OmpR family, alkaline phosphatase synthesis response regulator PhoP
LVCKETQARARCGLSLLAALWLLRITPGNLNINGNIVVNKISVVIVEDDQLTARLLGYQLRSAGYQCQIFHSPTAFIAAAGEIKPPDLFILDYDLGRDEPSGLELCRKISSYFNKPVIMLTGNEKMDTLVSCLSAGADQYICKPWDFRELKARIEVVLRKSAGQSTPSDVSSKLKQIFDGLITMDWDARQLRHQNGRHVEMTDKELGVMELFAADPQHYVDREHAFLVLYGYDMPPTNRSIDVLVSRVRKKMSEMDDTFRVKTMRGKGYQLFRTNTV